MQADALRTAGALVLLTRTLEQQIRAGSADQLGLAELGALRQIERGDDLPSLVARTMRLDPGRVTRITDHLVTLGYIEREQDARDRRRCRLMLTDNGAARLERGKEQIASAMNDLLAGLAAPEREALETGLEAVRAEL